MNNIERSFRDKALVAGRMNKPGFYLPNGATAPMDTNQMRAQQAVGNGRAGASNTIRLGVGEIMPERAGRPATPDFTLRGSVPAGQALVPTDGFDPSMRGKTSPLPEPAPRAPGLGDRLRAGMSQAKAGVGDLRAGVSSLFSGQAKPTDWKGMSKSVGAKAAGGAGGVLSNLNTATNMLASGSDLGMVWAAPNADLVEKTGASLEALGNTAGGFLVDRFNQGRGLITGGLTGAANQLTGSRPATQLARWMSPTGKSGIDTIRENNFGDESKHPIVELGEMAKPSAAKGAVTHPVAQAPAAATQEAKAPAETPFTRAGNLADEAKRQMLNATAPQYGGNGLLEKAQAGFERLRSGYGTNGVGGKAAFEDPSVQAAFNAKNMLEGTGIKVGRNENGVVEFSGDNRLGGNGKLYRAADGSLTEDWSKTQAYADAIQRNAKDQDRLAELTRGAALSGDREAVARLTAGDQRLAGIAKEAETEKSLRDAVKGGSRSAAMALAEMEKAQAANAVRQQEMLMRQQELAGAREDRALNRQLREDGLLARVLENQRAAAKDSRDNRQAQEQKQREILKDISVGADGKFDGNAYQLNLGRAANVKDDPNKTFDQNLADKASVAGLMTNLDNSQWWIDKFGTGPAGTAPEKWKPNDGLLGRLRGGFVTSDGKHVSVAQIKAMPRDQRQVFVDTMLDTTNVPKDVLAKLKGDN